MRTGPPAGPTTAPIPLPGPMSSARLLVVLTLLAALLCSGPAQALPRLTLRLAQVTFHEALIQVRAETGWDLRGPSGEGSDFYEPADNAPRATFHWRDASLGRVCRDLGAAFRAEPRHAGQNSIRFEPLPAGAPRRPAAHAVSREGLTLAATRVERARVLDLEAAPPAPANQVDIRLALRPAGGDPGVIYSLNRLAGADDRGSSISWERSEPLRPPTSPDGRPDEWSLDARLRGVDPRATRLAWLEAEVLLFQEVRHHRVEATLSGLQLPFSASAGAVELRLLEARQPGPFSLQVRLEESWPAELEVSSTAHGSPNWPYPTVRLASGRLQRMGGSASASLIEGRRRVALSCAFEGNPGDPPVAVVWDLLVKAMPDRRLTLRLQNIPLGAGIAAPAPVAPARPGGAAPRTAPPPPAGPGALVSTVLLGDRPGGEGELALGLSRRNADGTWGPVRWRVLDTDENGRAALEDVAPGEYRVLRRFRVPGTPVPAGTLWENASVTVRVRPGQRLDLPPLRGPAPAG